MDKIIFFSWIIALVCIFLVAMRGKKRAKAKHKILKQDISSGLVQNDKLIVVRNISETDIVGILKGFCILYEENIDPEVFKLVKVFDSEFAITFPYDIDFEIFCYLINQIDFGISDVPGSGVVGWGTVSSNMFNPSIDVVPTKIMLFISTVDFEGENIYLTTIDEIGYKHFFGSKPENKQLDFPERSYKIPPMAIDLVDKTPIQLV